MASPKGNSRSDLEVLQQKNAILMSENNRLQAEINRVNADREPMLHQIEDLQSSNLQISDDRARVHTELELLRETKQHMESKVQIYKASQLASLRLMVRYSDDPTEKHVKRVAHYAAAIAEKCGLDYDTVALIRIGAPFHDVGKIDPTIHYLINQERRLDPDEKLIVERHAPIGAEFIDTVTEQAKAIYSDFTDPLWVVMANLIRYHHKFTNGGGYPREDNGTVPIEARIVGLADTLDALLSDRPYKDALGYKAAFKLIEKDDPSWTGLTGFQRWGRKVMYAFQKAQPRIRAIHQASMATPSQ